MAAKSSKKKNQQDVLDQFIGAIRGHGDKPVAILVRDVLNVEHPTTDQVKNAILLFCDDARFLVTDKGMESTVRMADEEPQDITDEAKASQEERRNDPSAGEPFASPALAVGTDGAGRIHEASVVPTIGEQLEQDEAKEAATATRVEVVENVEVESSLDSMTIVRLKQVKQAIDAQQNTIHHLKEDLKEHTKRLEVLEAERDQLIDGEIPPTQMGNKDPEQTPIAKAARGETPMIVEPPVAGMYRKMGAEFAAQGKTELDCPITRETNASGLSMWMDGFREAKREDHTERPAIVQALTREQMVEKMLPHNGILPQGEDTPKVVAVEWDKRPHLVLDMLADGEGPTAGQERWALLPLFKRDEWSSGEGCPAMTYGDPIADVDANPERRETRIKGGINCARLVKVGRSKLVCGPLQLMSIATVKTEPAAEEQPPY